MSKPIACSDAMLRERLQKILLLSSLSEAQISVSQVPGWCSLGGGGGGGKKTFFVSELMTLEYSVPIIDEYTLTAVSLPLPLSLPLSLPPQALTLRNEEEEEEEGVAPCLQFQLSLFL